MAPPITPNQAGIWSNLSLLMWKNFLLQIRHKFQTLLDITLPVLVFVLLAYLQKISNPEVHPQPTHFPPIEIDTLDTLWFVILFFIILIC